MWAADRINPFSTATPVPVADNKVTGFITRTLTVESNKELDFVSCGGRRSSTGCAVTVDAAMDATATNPNT
jgi:hypothetical protein